MTGPKASAAQPAALFSALPARQGLYDACCEHDACGVAMVATLRGEPGHDIVDAALTALRDIFGIREAPDIGTTGLPPAGGCKPWPPASRNGLQMIMAIPAICI